jgi:hypothetical protein
MEARVVSHCVQSGEAGGTHSAGAPCATNEGKGAAAESAQAE